MSCNDDEAFTASTPVKTNTREPLKESQACLNIIYLPPATNCKQKHKNIYCKILTSGVVD
jgi:hypothetical protein